MPWLIFGQMENWSSIAGIVATRNCWVVVGNLNISGVPNWPNQRISTLSTTKRRVQDGGLDNHTP